MTSILYMRLTLTHVWRVLRAWKFPFVALTFLLLISINVLLSSRTGHVFSRNHEVPEVFGLRQLKPIVVDPSSSLSQENQEHSKLLLPILLKEGHSAVSPQPEVKNQLSFGVQEEENSAKEVLDGDNVDKDNLQQKIEDNAANEVNSVEPELNVVSKSVNEELEKSFHELPADQRETFDENDISKFNNWRNLSASELHSLSVLGRRLFLNENVGTVQNKNFTILFWKTGPTVERRFLKQFGKEKLDPFRKCSVRNCILSYDDSLLDTADAILIHFHRTKGPSSFPVRTNFNQRWIWLTDESPYHTFMAAKTKKMVNYNGYFNWSMSYRMDTDIPVPYGRTILMTEKEMSLYKKIDYFNLKSKTVAVMGSNCGGKNKRWNYVKDLKNYMEVDVYGGCGNLKCPGHFTADCAALADYKFYLAFENGNCQEYITEKVWWNSFEKGAVPVVMGGKIEDYRKILPPDSFIHIDEFSTPQHLAQYLLDVANDAERYMGYHAWRSKFRVVNEHGYFGTDVFHYCRICEALNYNDRATKVYNHMETFWNAETQCYPPTWQTVTGA